MIHPITKLRVDHCPECDTPRSLECYNDKKSGINYTLFVDSRDRGKDLKEKIEPLELLYFKCRRCGKVYNIDWRTRFPIPLFDEIPYYNFLLGRKINKE